MLPTTEQTDGDALMAMQWADQEAMKEGYLSVSYGRLKPDDEPTNVSQGEVRSRQPLDLSISFSQPPTLLRCITRMEKELPLPQIGHSSIWVFAPCLMGPEWSSAGCLDEL